MAGSIVSFEEFLRTGCLGPLWFGINKNEVREVIGKPEKPEHMEDYPDGTSVWCYFPVEVRFCRDLVEVIGIGFTWWDGRMPVRLKASGFFPTKDTKMATIRAFLTDSAIPFEVGKDGRMLRTSAGVWIFPTTEDKDTIMSASKECGGPSSFFDERFRVQP